MTLLPFGLSALEAKKVKELLGRDPTLVEATIFGIQGSEHCSYKSSKRFLRLLPTEGKHVILGPGEDSGIVAITSGPAGKRWGLVISHESHNKPSQVVPFEGAATGVGGVVRDVLCMGARVIGCMDMLRLGDLATDESRTIATEVARGIGGYGNPIGVPNLGGDTFFDAANNAQCLVNCVAIGIVREDEVIRSTVPADAGKVGYDIVVIGKPTDRSGFGGAAFASDTLTEGEESEKSAAVQEPNPFLERHLLASTYDLFDLLVARGALSKVSFKDLGAGGVVCASVEQVSGRNFGAEVHLDRVHTAVPNLPPEVIACAETQERMCWICHPDLTDIILHHYNDTWDLPAIAEGAKASVIGKVTEDGMYRLFHKGELVCEAKSTDITYGFLYERPVRAPTNHWENPDIHSEGSKITVHPSDYKLQTTNYTLDIEEVFNALVSHRNYASRDPIILHYDKDVIGNTLIEAGEGDAGVVAPLQDLRSYALFRKHPSWEELPETEKWVGIALGASGNPRYGRISPYLQGANAVVEALCNVVASGATPRALTDCLNYGDPEDPEKLWSLAEGVRGIADAARGIRIENEAIPVISGNVSLYNGAIDPTAIVCCVGVLPDARNAIRPNLKEEGSHLFLLGKRKDECGGSAFHLILEELLDLPRNALLGSNPPKPDFDAVARMIAFVTSSIGEKRIQSCHDVSEGGMLLALLEMTLPHRKQGGSIGIDIDLSALESDLSPSLLFSETPGFILEVREKDAPLLIKKAKTGGLPLFLLGRTTGKSILRVRDGSTALLEAPLPKLHTLWKEGLAKRLAASD